MKYDREQLIRRRFDRQFQKMARFAPVLERLRTRRWAPVRWTLAAVLMIGGLLAILPFFGLWMIPLGLLLLAVDVTSLQNPVTGVIIRGRRRLESLRRRWRRR